MKAAGAHDFGSISENGDRFEYHIDTRSGGVCRLASVTQTERGPRRVEVAEVPGSVWRTITVRVVRELAQGMDERERVEKELPRFRTGVNRLSPLIGRELAVLLWAIEEEGALERLEALLHGWRELAREERWWLYAKAGAPGQSTGVGWRRALYHALAEVPESRADNIAPAKKKSRGTRSSSPTSTRKGLTATAKPKAAAATRAKPGPKAPPRKGISQAPAPATKPLPEKANTAKVGAKACPRATKEPKAKPTPKASTKPKAVKASAPVPAKTSAKTAVKTAPKSKVSKPRKPAAKKSKTPTS